MTFGEKLSKLRKEYNYTQEQLADILGVSRQSISKWESNIAYPETDKLVKIGRLFECTMDYLLNEDVTEKHDTQTNGKVYASDLFKRQITERKSERTVYGMPLYHIGKNAHGFFAVGLKASGVFSIGFISKGIVSFGLLSIGVISFGILPFGLISLGVLSIGLLAAGAIALGLFAAGAISIGLISFGALSVGCFSMGALAIGKYAAVGDHAYGMIAIGKTVADGSIYSHNGDLNTADLPALTEYLDANVPSWLNWASKIFKMIIS